MLVEGAGASKDDRLPLSDEDILLLNETYRDTDAEVYYLLLQETGLRVSELAGIQVGDVSLQDRSLHVQPNDIRGLKTKGSQRIRLRTHNQNRTVAARAIADMKTFGHLS